jgi:hypothetical protein
VNYQDFDLLIDRAAENLRAQVMSSPAGQATAEFRLPFSEDKLENFLRRLGDRTRPGTTRRVETQEMTAAKAFGAALFNAVFSGEVKACFRSSFDEARRQNAGLRIRLRLADPTVVDLPWEYLYNPAVNRFLALSIHTPLVRYMDLPERIQPISVTPPIRVLVMISSPTDFPALDVEGESARLNEALADLTSRNQIAIERLDAATLEALQRRLQRERYHIFHFIGHGEVGRDSQEGVLILEGEDGRAHRVGSQSLGTMLRDNETLRVVILNACAGARTSRTDPFAGSARSLVRQGIAAAIAMQFEIANDVASRFAHEFYGALADGYPIDASLTEARQSIFAAGHEVEWGTPALYLRAPDGRVFDVSTIVAPSAAQSGPPFVQSSAPLSEDENTRHSLRAAGHALACGRYAEALEMLRHYEPGNKAAEALREVAEQQRSIAEERARADQARQQQRAEEQRQPDREEGLRRRGEAELEASKRWYAEERMNEAIARSQAERVAQAARERREQILASDPQKNRLPDAVPPSRGSRWARLREWLPTFSWRTTARQEGQAADPSAGAASDIVNCTVFSPLKVPADQPFMVQVTAHVPEQTGEAAERATQADPEAKPRGGTAATGVVPHVSRLTFLLTMPGAEVMNAVQTLTWKRTTEIVQFEVRVSRDCTATCLIGTVIVSQDGIPFGHVKFVVSVSSQALRAPLGEQRPRETANWKRYKHAFVSYAAADRSEVIKRVQMLARVSIDFFQDLLKLEPGERWERELYKQIDRSDVFFLFWSTAAKNSEWVGKEIDYALRRKGGDELAEPEIVPIVIEGPPPVPPPPALRHLHFNDPLLYFIQPGTSHSERQ